MSKDKTPNPLVEGEDFYWENGFFVFTEKFLRKRGYCCGSGCRHCPYGRQKNGRDVSDSDLKIKR
ncbi:MAG: hypothetical protein KGS48_00905 [Bacteroidetes bacterium]|nr:hypothetical protein [Bacteroidota bacterium]